MQLQHLPQKVQSALPLFLAFVIGFGFLALMVLFRSLVIPITAAVTSLLSFAGALGVTVAVAVLIAALRWPADGPVDWINIAIGSNFALMLWTAIFWLRRRRQ